MSQADIRKRKKEIEKEIARARGQLRVAKAKLSALQEECAHPRLRKYYAMGEPGDICDDCGYQT